MDYQQCVNHFFDAFPPNPKKFYTWINACNAYYATISAEDVETLRQYQFNSKMVNTYLAEREVSMRMYKGSVNELVRDIDVQLKRLYSEQYIYGSVNHWHWLTNDILLHCVREMINDLIRIIEASPITTTPFMVYRGLTQPFFTSREFTREGVHVRPIRRYRGFMSTSSDSNITTYFRGVYGNVLCITVPPGVHCLPCIGDETQHHRGECEVLFSPTVRMELDRYDFSRNAQLTDDTHKNLLFVSIVPEEHLAGAKRKKPL